MSDNTPDEIASDGTEPRPGEIWQDSEGCLLSIVDDGYCFAFGFGSLVKISDMRPQDQPNKIVFTNEGDYVGTGPLEYPGGSNRVTRDDDGNVIPVSLGGDHMIIAFIG